VANTRTYKRKAKRYTMPKEMYMVREKEILIRALILRQSSVEYSVNFMAPQRFCKNSKLGLEIRKWCYCLSYCIKIMVKFSPLQALEALKVMRG
jgi:hypothetical protein